MFEHITYETLLARMLKTALAINKNLDSREGSLLWLGQAPAAVELQNLYIALDHILDSTFADTAAREYLIRRAAERGFSPLPATAAILELTITPETLDLALGTRFSVGELNYTVSKRLGGGKFEITCETVGEAGNDYSGEVFPIEYISGLQTCTVTGLLVPGEDEEETEQFRKRYFDSLNAQAFGGNRADYLEKVSAIPGVGGVKIYRAWNGDLRPADLIPPAGAEEWIKSLSGVQTEVLNWLKIVFEAAKDRKLTVGGTVRLVIMDSTYSPPSDTLIDLVQTTVDPIQNAGEGYGLAPIGHVVKVEGVRDEEINLSFSLLYRNGYSWADVEGEVREQITAYLIQLAKEWPELEKGIVVRVSQIESRILDLDPILDITETTINGKSGNFAVSDNSLPTLGTIRAGSMN